MRAFFSRRRRRLAAAIESGLALSAESIQGSALLLIGVAVGLAGYAVPASAFTYVVDTTADVPTPNKTTLRQAVFQANGSANNIVQFDPALNGSTITLTQGEIAINQSMYIVGPGADQLTISGNDASRIFYISTAANMPIPVNLSGLRLTHGKTYGHGGAIYAVNVSLTVQDSVLEYNASGTLGGALDSYGTAGGAAASTLTRVTIAKNQAPVGGGFAFFTGSSLHVSDSVITANTADMFGGGASLSDIGSITIEGSQFTGNHATSYGAAGVSIDNLLTQPVHISGSAFTGNIAATNGGGLLLANVNATLSQVTVSGNSANAGGGIFVGFSGSPQSSLALQQSTVSGNVANARGGGIDVNNALNFAVDQSLISGNSIYDSAGGGGGIAIEYAKNPSYIRNSTIYGNYAYNHGGGVGIFSGFAHTTFYGVTIASNNTSTYASNGILGAGSTVLYNCVVANNSSHASTQDLVGTFSEKYSLIGNVGTASVTGHDNKNGQNPLLGPLAVNGGPTRTMLPALASPLLDAGSSSLAGTDQRGLPRDANGRRDIGAVERQYPEDIIFRGGFDSS